MNLKIKSLHFILYILVLIGMISCSNEKSRKESKMETASFAVKDFNPISNFPLNKEGKIEMNLDFVNSLTDGFVIPSVRQVGEGVFVMKFRIQNKSGKNARFGYKIYYQNESYKFSETDDSGNSFNPLAVENFYGSWEDSLIEFKSTTMIPSDGNFHTVIDSFRIVGNPRNELRYFENGKNDRWKRNPRVGSYSFLLAVTIEENLKSATLPVAVKNIGRTENGSFIHPYFYFLHGNGKSVKDLAYIKSEQVLKVAARPDLGQGIYVNPFNFTKETHGKYFHDDCNQDSAVYHNAAFEQFINNVDPSMRFENIPVVRDIMGNDYTKVDYNWDKAFYRNDEMISTLPGISRRPCETVYSDKAAHKLVLKNPATKEGIWRKESVGIRTRHGFVYGKYRLKCKLTELLNKDNVWNGLTNAIWLLSQQGSGPWNNRRSCDKAGYMASYWGGDNDKRVPIVDYSEIDFEILKTPPYCPSYKFPPVIKNPVNDSRDISRWNVEFPEELKEADGMITVACTNWDMACMQPVNFKSGCNEIKYEENTFNSHRWTDTYRALTQKKYASDDELFGSEYYYFEIDWRPDEIIWRIGPSPDKMQVVGYMNDEVTTIPNNQMTLIVTQEYHNTKWWPGSPFVQENVPFPSKELVGEIYELVIE